MKYIVLLFVLFQFHSNKLNSQSLVDRDSILLSNLSKYSIDQIDKFIYQFNNNDLNRENDSVCIKNRINKIKYLTHATEFDRSNIEIFKRLENKLSIDSLNQFCIDITNCKLKSIGKTQIVKNTKTYPLFLYFEQIVDTNGIEWKIYDCKSPYFDIEKRKLNKRINPSNNEIDFSEAYLILSGKSLSNANNIFTDNLCQNNCQLLLFLLEKRNISINPIKVISYTLHTLDNSKISIKYDNNIQSIYRRGWRITDISFDEI